MRFHRVQLKSQINPKEVLATYFNSESGNYRVHQSRNGKQWLAFFRTNRDSDDFSLVGPPVETKQAAIDQCCEHSLSLPW